jgi:hypothetical protein
MTEAPTSFVAECFWNGVTEEDLRGLDERAEASASQLALSGESVRYLGSMLMRHDQVVLCLFEGSASAVRSAAEQAGIPFERILESTLPPWRAPTPPTELDQRSRRRKE